MTATSPRVHVPVHVPGRLDVLESSMQRAGCGENIIILNKSLAVARFEDYSDSFICCGCGCMSQQGGDGVRIGGELE